MCSTAFLAKTLPFPCVFHYLVCSTAFLAKTMPLPWGHQLVGPATPEDPTAMFAYSNLNAVPGGQHFYLNTDYPQQ